MEGEEPALQVDEIPKRRCVACGREYAGTPSLCPHCGYPQKASYVAIFGVKLRCPHCGYEYSWGPYPDALGDEERVTKWPRVRFRCPRCWRWWIWGQEGTSEKPMREEVECPRCKYRWHPRRKRGAYVCPACWFRFGPLIESLRASKKVVECPKCGHRWHPRKESRFYVCRNCWHRFEVQQVQQHL